MKHFWMTAAVGALCAFAVQAWAAPQTQLLELVATKHHHLRGAQAAEHPGKSHKHAKGAKSSKSSAKASRSKSGRHSAKSRREEAVRSRHGGSLRSRRAEARAAREEAARPRHEAGGRSRRHAVVVSDIKSDKARSVKVGRRDTLAGIARKTGVSVEALARLNRLRKPYHVRSGAYLKLPTRRYYIVKSGDTLYSLSRRFGVDAEDLSAFNSVGRGKPIRSGQKLYLPDEAADANARREPEPEPVERPARRTSRSPSFAPIPYTPLPTTPQPSNETPSSPAPAEETAPAAGAQTPGAPAVQPFQMAPERPRTPSYQAPAPSGGRPAIIQTSPPPTAAEVVSAGRGKFAWPANGTLISVFGPTPNGQRNDGVNILAKVGEPVRAAADGQVVYAGDQVPSFGNLVLVKHDGGWVTAYAHMSKILVHNRDQVVQGQQLGEVGQTGSVDRPQLHFEIRYAASAKDKATPVDPGLLLPQP